MALYSTEENNDNNKEMAPYSISVACPSTILYTTSLPNTTSPIASKVYGNDPCVNSFHYCQRNSISFKTLVAMATNMKNFRNQ